MQNSALEGINSSKKIADLAEYGKDISENNNAIKNASYQELYAQLQKMVTKYNADINAAGLINGIKVVYDLPSETFTIQSMTEQLRYINRMIPFFASAREGGKCAIEQFTKHII